jgi:hypothetical protein
MREGFNGGHRLILPILFHTDRDTTKWLLLECLFICLLACCACVSFTTILLVVKLQLCLFITRNMILKLMTPLFDSLCIEFSKNELYCD